MSSKNVPNVSIMVEYNLVTIICGLVKSLTQKWVWCSSLLSYLPGGIAFPSVAPTITSFCCHLHCAVAPFGCVFLLTTSHLEPALDVLRSESIKIIFHCSPIKDPKGALLRNSKIGLVSIWGGGVFLCGSLPGPSGVFYGFVF